MGHFLGWSFGTKSLSLTVSEILRPKHHVLIDNEIWDKIGYNSAYIRDIPPDLSV